MADSAAPALPLDAEDRDRLLSGAHHDPHGLLGAHPTPEGVRLRALHPFARAVTVVSKDLRAALTNEGDGFFSAVLPLRAVPEYTLLIQYGDAPGVDEFEIHDPYRFLPALGDLDLHLIGEGRHEELWKALGAQPMDASGRDRHPLHRLGAQRPRRARHR